MAKNKSAPLKGHLMLAAVLLAACSDPATPRGGGAKSVVLSDTQVELDVFSGRQNPNWALTAAETRSLESHLIDLPRSRVPVPDGGLGYRKFIVRDGNVRIDVGRGLVVVSRGVVTDVYNDRHGAENYLLALATQRGYGDLIETKGIVETLVVK